MAKGLEHVCILVKDIDQAIEHYIKILRATAPDLLEQKLEKKEMYAGEDRFTTVFFIASGDGCSIQLLQPLNPESPLYKRLEKYGEHIHHLAFSSPLIEETFKCLKENEVSLHADEFVIDKYDPSQKWVWILPRYAHGALIEVWTGLEA